MWTGFVWFTEDAKKPPQKAGFPSSSPSCRATLVVFIPALSGLAALQ